MSGHRATKGSRSMAKTPRGKKNWTYGAEEDILAIDLKPTVPPNAVKMAKIVKNDLTEAGKK